MDTYALVKLLHLFTMVGAFAVSAVLHFNLARVRKAERIPQALDALASTKRLSPITPLFPLFFFLTGGYLTQNRWTWAMPWVHVSAVGLLSMLLVSLTILKPRVTAFAMRLAKAGDGPITDELRAPLRDPLLGAASHYGPIMAAAIMVMMTMKTGLTGSLIAVGVALALSVLSSRR